jgi:hypothetical protein
MRWFVPKLRNSLNAVLSTMGADPPRGEGHHNIEDIRQNMLELVAEDGGERSMRLSRRIRYASDLQALWFMRGEIMGLLARLYGEAAAREKVEQLSSMFADLLPPGLRSRPSPIGRDQRPNRFGSDD